jgi:hypothetical protein
MKIFIMFMLVSHVASGSALDLEEFISAPVTSSQSRITSFSFFMSSGSLGTETWSAYAPAHVFCCRYEYACRFSSMPPCIRSYLAERLGELTSLGEMDGTEIL